MDGLSVRHRPRSLPRIAYHGSLLVAVLCLGLGCVHLPEQTSTLVPPPSGPKGEDEECRRKPNYASAWVALGDYYAASAVSPRCSSADKERMYEHSCRAYELALKKDRNCVEAYLGLGRLHQGAENYQAASAAYKDALARLPKEACLWYELGMCHARLREWKPALDNLRTAVELDPANVIYANSLGFCLGRIGRYDESLTVFTKTQGPAKAHYFVARMHQHVCEEAACREHLAKALEIEPNLRVARRLLTELDETERQPDRSAVVVSFDGIDDAISQVNEAAAAAVPLSIGHGN